MSTKWQPGQSGNPKGRPSGTTLAGKLRAAVGCDFDQLVEVIKSHALAGDMTAAKLLLERVAPPLKPVQEPMPVGMSGKTLSDKAASVLDRVSEGRLSAADAKLLLDGLAAVARIHEVDELLRRVESLEAWEKRQNGKSAPGPS